MEDMTLCVEPSEVQEALAQLPPASCVLGAQRGGSKATEEEAVASCE